MGFDNRSGNEINFYQDFLPVKDANLFFKISRFAVYENIPKYFTQANITYWTVIAEKFHGIGESMILGIQIDLASDNNSFDVRSKYLIRYGDPELMDIIHLAIVKTLVRQNTQLQNNRYRVIIKKRA
jgi:hypothetical protein